jgi:membrane peptidoglycan carboxypeptidase
MNIPEPITRVLRQLADRARGWRRPSIRQLLLEATIVAAGVGCGVLLSVALLWTRARADVTAYLASPPRPPPSVVWSAPVEVRAGLGADIEAIAADLLASGLDRVDRASDPPPGTVGQFAITKGGAGLDVWTNDWPHPDGAIEGGHFQIEVKNGRVSKTTPRSVVVLPPTVLGTLGDPETQRSTVQLADLSKWIEPALLSMEDRRFRSHGGVDPIGILRAVFADLTQDQVQGGSTLTQQLAKNLFLTSERTIKRKVREVFFAAALEASLDKDQLLELYLSEIYLGQMAGMPLYGVEAAARAWFGSSASKLDLAQAATIVGVIPAPNTWSPVRNVEAAKGRRDVVLDRMAKDGIITPQEFEQAVGSALVLDGLAPSRVRRAPYAVDLAVKKAEAAVPEGAFASGGYALHTSIQPLLQRAAEQAITLGMAEVEAANPKIVGAQAALVAVRLTDGAVVALVGGRSYPDSPFNRAQEAHRQVGSTVKPFTMLGAFEAGVASPASRLEDMPITRDYGGEIWSPKNYDNTFLGEVSVRQAIEQSRNIPAIHLAESFGFGKLSRLLHQLGFADATGLPSAALGSFPATPMEMAAAYTVFDDGEVVRPRVLLSIDDDDGEPVFTFAVERERVVSEAAAALAVNVLEGVLSSGTGARASHYGVGNPAAGKSGTTDEYRDAWFVGLTREYAVAVWVGQDEGILGLSGAKAALPSWARFVADTAMSKEARRMPSGVVSAEVCPDSGMLARMACPEPHGDWFIAGHVPEKCDEHGEIAIFPAEWIEKWFGRKGGRKPRPGAAPPPPGAPPPPPPRRR